MVKFAQGFLAGSHYKGNARRREKTFRERNTPIRMWVLMEEAGKLMQVEDAHAQERRPPAEA